jgi:hypothetical protein
MSLMTTPVLARSTDPITSDLAVPSADKLTKMQAIVLSIFDERGDLTDSELNDFYANHREARGWPEARHETPRKRRSDLSSRNLLVDTLLKRRNDENGLEVVWGIPSQPLVTPPMFELGDVAA